ncbi:hypothetical protein DM01DRAFT_1338269 [Hesseltinella vesiculosa]|uniref:Galactose oxidase n=1 Tax=Hesseltinella vesiculosa TaxID=101127 RepID=A0A1X2GAB0_9FUNG|nr:hypothetical protein DM01DRAFT_1338269 [Hesseltinella vesiculosa]
MAFATAPAPMARVGCVMLAKTLYCYGGSNTASLNNITTYNTHYSLDLSSDFATSSINWKQVPPPNSFTLEPNAAFAMVALNDNSYVIIGGAGNNSYPSQLTNLTTIYNATNNQWQSIPTNLNSPVTINGSFGGNGLNANFTRLTVVGSKDDKGNVWVWDGSTSISPGATMATATFDVLNSLANPSAWAGTQSFTMVNENQWIKRNYMASVISSAGVIYYIGGRDCFYTTDASTMDCSNFASMGNIFTFDTTTSAWAPMNISTANLPPVRSGHTCIYVNRTNEIIMYGGNNLQGYVKWGYVAVLDLNQKAWRSSDISGSNGAGPRAIHTAVNYNDTYMIIAFGSDSTNNPLNDIYFANIQDTQSMYWATSFYTNGTTSGTGPPGSTTGSPSSGLSTGALVGIIVGCVAAAILVASAGVWIYRQYRRGILFHPGQPPTGFSEPIFPTGHRSDQELMGSLDDHGKNNFRTFSQDESTTLTSPTLQEHPMKSIGKDTSGSSDNPTHVKPFGVEYQAAHTPMYDPSAQKPSGDS